MPKLTKRQIMIVTRLLIIIFLSTSILTYGQNGNPSQNILNITNITFKDTIFNIAFDSTTHNLGNIVPTNENNRIVKHFKYIGKEPISIKRVWTGDPHFICNYPNEPLKPNTIYSFTVCFNHQGRYVNGGYMQKNMGFDLSDGNKVVFKFTGKYSPIETQIKDSLIYHIFNCKNNAAVVSQIDNSLHIYGLYISDSIVKTEGPRTTSLSKSIPMRQVIYYKPAFYEINDLREKLVYKKDTLIINSPKKYTYLIAVNQSLTIGKKTIINEENFLPFIDIFRINHNFSFGYQEGIGGEFYPKVNIQAFPEFDTESASWGYVLYYTKEDGSAYSKIHTDSSVKIVNIIPDSICEPIIDYSTKQIENLGLPYLAWHGHLDNDSLVDLILRYCKTNKDGLCEDEFQLVLSSNLKESYRRRIKKREH